MNCFWRHTDLVDIVAHRVNEVVICVYITLTTRCLQRHAASCDSAAAPSSTKEWNTKTQKHASIITLEVFVCCGMLHSISLAGVGSRNHTHNHETSGIPAFKLSEIRPCLNQFTLSIIENTWDSCVP
jgi:hypothetical protein